MKANEAPEKLFFGESDKGFLDIYSNREPNDEVEYTRTDAFIEKASGWIEENIKKWNENIKVHGLRGITPLMITEFRKHMKGE